MKSKMITMTLHLTPSQRLVNGNWIVTINGEPVEVNSNRVLYHASDMIEALRSFNPEEVDMVKIERESLILTEEDVK